MIIKAYWFLKDFLDYIVEYWKIATIKNSSYIYVIEDIQLQEKNKTLASQIYYRLIGSRVVLYSSASELNSSEIFSKFSPIQAQIIVTLSTIEKMMLLDKETLILHYKDYIRKCAKICQLQKKK